MKSMLEFDGKKLKQLRKDKGMTQTEVAEKVGKETAHISNYENGYATPQSDTLLSLMEFFKISPDAISKTPNTN